jgi:hypothetical protein
LEPPNPKFEWVVFADATCAGLSVLIPLPLVDLLFETIFRRRIPGTISKARGRDVEPAVRRRLARPVTASALSWSGCLVVPFAVLRYILRRLWRKIIYILAVKDATAALTEYWHRAFLTDHMIRIGHLDEGADTDLAVKVFRRVLRDIDPSPLTGLARQTVANVGNVFRLLIRARRRGAPEVTRSLGDVLFSHWRGVEASLNATANHYNVVYENELDARGVGASAMSE